MGGFLTKEVNFLNFKNVNQVICKAEVRKVCPMTPAIFSTPVDPNRCKYFYHALDVSTFLHFHHAVIKLSSKHTFLVYISVMYNVCVGTPPHTVSYWSSIMNPW